MAVCRNPLTFCARIVPAQLTLPDPGFANPQGFFIQSYPLLRARRASDSPYAVNLRLTMVGVQLTPSLAEARRRDFGFRMHKTNDATRLEANDSGVSMAIHLSAPRPTELKPRIVVFGIGGAVSTRA